MNGFQWLKQKITSNGGNDEKKKKKTTTPETCPIWVVFEIGWFFFLAEIICITLVTVGRKNDDYPHWDTKLTQLYLRVVLPFEADLPNHSASSDSSAF